MRSILILLLSVGLLRAYPLYKQCNDVWRDEKMGNTTTICKDGCLMSSVSMFMNGLLIDGKEANPSTLNAWL